ncbi:unnamed protein product [Caenorhabditis nigoni]|uniref:TGF-beta family profile domain-containing protein n=1 Tax=Caenorhabditis nigoni TaxID=1611254 RepID=A0A2G5SAT5_9PELO|nr:hypothetical protein B9Z55_028706 [Caenorhabditis nigoni]
MKWLLLLLLTDVVVQTSAKTVGQLDDDKKGCGKDKACLETLKAYRTREVLERIIEQLPGAPISDAAVQIDPELRKMYVDFYEDERHKNSDFNRQDVDTYFYSAKDPFDGEDSSQMVAMFDVTQDLEKKYEILEAKLMVSTTLPTYSRNILDDVRVQVFEKNGDNSLGELVKTQSFRITGGERITIDLPVGAAKRWFASSGSFHGIFVSAMLEQHNIAVHPQQETKDSEKMILQLSLRNKEFVGQSTNSTLRRSRRSPSAAICATSQPSEGCCLYDLIVEFNKIGWDWVIAPPRYNAFMCRGQCEKNAHHLLNDFGHARIMRAANSIYSVENMDLTSLGLCCHASDFDYLKVIYLNQQGVINVANLNGMVANRCGCS